MRKLLILIRAAPVLAVLWPWAGARAQDVFIRVPVELGGTATRMTLPFGEPFLLVGSAPELLKQVDARFMTFTTTDPPTSARCGPLLEDTSSAVVAAAARPWIRNPRVNADTFAVLVPTGLRANVRYAFCVQTQSGLDSTSLSGFQRRAYQVLDTTYRAQDHPLAGPPQDLPADMVAELQRRLAGALPTDQGRIETRGTIFDTAAGAVSEKDLVFTTDVLRWQRDRFLAGNDLTNARALARSRLAGFAGDRTLEAIAGTIDGSQPVPGMDSATVERVAATARALVFPNPGHLLEVAGGEAVLSPSAVLSTSPLPPNKVTDRAEIAVRTARIDSTYRRLLEVRDFTDALRASAALRNCTRVTAVQAAALRARIDAVLQTFQQMREVAARWAHADAQRNTLLLTAARSLRVTASDRVPVVATTISSFETRATQYVTADLGLVYAPALGQVLPYFGANFYPGALNKRVPLRLARPRELDRWSLTVGVTATSLAKEDDRKDLFSSLSLLVGAGRRMTDPLRLTGGVVLYRQLDENPLVDDSNIAASPFVSLSFDFDARAALGRLGQVIFP